jgi:DNA-binding NarL/FixJ family response regulator
MSKVRKKRQEGKVSQIFLVDDHPIFCDGLSRLLMAEKDMTVCGHAKNATIALKSIVRLKPDLAVVDLGLPGKSGLELIKEIRALKFPVKLLVVSMFDEAIYAQRVLRAGGDGYVMKQEDPDVIVLAIRDVLAGHIYVSEDIFGKYSSKGLPGKDATSLDLLTDSELEILELFGSRKTKDAIVLQLGITKAEVDRLGAGICRKLKLRGSQSLIRYAIDWVDKSSI